MAHCCFLIYPLTKVADESFLQLLFDDSVKRSAFLGYPPRRFAIVELEESQNEAVLRAIGARDDDGRMEAREDNADTPFVDLFTGTGAKKGTDRNEPIGLRMGCIPHLSQVRFRRTYLRVIVSPVTIDELFGCVQKDSNHVKKEKRSLKRSRHTDEDAGPWVPRWPVANGDPTLAGRVEVVSMTGASRAGLSGDPEDERYREPYAECSGGPVCNMSPPKTFLSDDSAGDAAGRRALDVSVQNLIRELGFDK
ncbi:hypothetical protein DPX39_090017600 [Trypanosoma brucei equiperdum]|uniref:Uncharacterized protein n=1 Tax=Trypanosoma brucei equiperdum TaxID=630700 RepID=A0A3L6L0S5_9TRYP|nr:hypothetical protein DPX39_090017600 [Trypanosoma brucei equiperdum]